MKTNTAALETFHHFTQVREAAAKMPGRPKVWATMLYGSQNYGLDSPESDVDTKTMLLPSLHMLISDSKRISTEVVMRDGSLDNCKDLREMFGNYLKGNINFVETLFTDYYVCDLYQNFFEELRGHRDLIANAQPRKLVHMACGMARQKYVAFDKPFEGKKGVLAKYGYDPKQLHHLVRLFYFMEKFSECLDFETALNCCRKERDSLRHDWLMNLKLNPLPLDKAKDLKESFMAKCEKLTDDAEKLPEDLSYAAAKDVLDDLAQRLITVHLREELKYE